MLNIWPFNIKRKQRDAANHMVGLDLAINMKPHAKQKIHRHLARISACSIAAASASGDKRQEFRDEIASRAEQLRMSGLEVPSTVDALQKLIKEYE